MNNSGKSGLLWAASLAMLAAGCAGNVSQARKYERAGQYHLAYEEYVQAVDASPGDSTATSGVRRTARLAAGHWQRRAFSAAESESWEQASKCHLKVLQIKPNEYSSVFTLRQIAQHHPDDLQRAYEVLFSGQLPGELLAAATPGPEQPTASGPSQEDTTKGPPPPAMAVDPYKQRPTARHDPGASGSAFITTIRVSRDDDRFPKKAPLIDALSIKVKDTDESPLVADMELYLGRTRIARFRALRTNSVISVLGGSAKLYEIVILEINDGQETVAVGVRKP